MISNTLPQQWEPYSKLIPFEQIAARLEYASKIVPDDIQFLLPCISLAKDGPVVEAVLLVSSRYICEVRLNQNEHDFDLALLGTIGNYRVEIGTKELTREDPSPDGASTVSTITRYEYAKIKLVHTINLVTEFSYVGERRSEWINRVFQILPITLLETSLRAIYSDED